jgi:hypothetical protein
MTSLLVNSEVKLWEEGDKTDEQWTVEGSVMHLSHREEEFTTRTGAESAQ